MRIFAKERALYKTPSQHKQTACDPTDNGWNRLEVRSGSGDKQREGLRLALLVCAKCGHTHLVRRGRVVNGEAATSHGSHATADGDDQEGHRPETGLQFLLS